MTLSDTWHALTLRAALIDPNQIRAAIHETHDRWPGGGTGEPVTGGGLSDPTATAATRQRASNSDRDLARITTHISGFVVATAQLSKRSHSKTPPATWDEAVHTAGLLDEMDAIATLERIGRAETSEHVHHADNAIDELARLSAKHLARQPTDLEAAWTSGLADEECCSVHLSVEPAGRYRERRWRRDLCRVCYDLAAAGDVDAPPVWLIEVWVDKPGQVTWRNARNRWLEAQGVRSA